MDKETQDLAWACLPKEARNEIKRKYALNAHLCSSSNERVRIIGDSQNRQLDEIFGEHNLNSDTEPTEFICVERVKVDALQSEIFKEIMDAHDAEDWQSVAHYILDVMPRSFHVIFGDKCLPDKELEHRLEQTSVQVEPKFSIGDGVIFRGGCYKITGIEHSQKGIRYAINFPNNEHKCIFKESELEPYTEPESRNLSQETANCDKHTHNILSDEELDNIIFELIRIRDNRRENERQLTEVLAKFHEKNSEE